MFRVGVAQNVAALDAKSGFRTYKFGMAPSAISNLVRIKQDPYGNRNVFKYTKKDENLLLGPYKLSGITYEFYKDKLMNVTLSTDANNAKGILELLLKLYGNLGQSAKADNNVREVNNYEWFGKKVELTVSIWAGGDFGSVSYSGIEVFDEMFRDEKNDKMMLKRRIDTKKQEALKEL